VNSRFVYPSRVRFVDTDASQRIHYTAMLKHFEYAEIEFLRSLGMPYKEMKKHGLDWPRVHVECDYLSPPFYDDVLDIAVTVERVGNTSFTLAFDALLGERPAARGRIVIVCVKEGRPHPLPDEVAGTLRRAAA
jgi:YbgC/YbaW family acyl-CoA thioester hydrolase